MTLIDNASELLKEKVSTGILLFRKPVQRHGVTTPGSGTVFDILLLFIALSWYSIFKIWDPIVASGGATYLAVTEKRLVFFAVNEKWFRRSLGGVTSQRELKELKSITFESDGDKEVRLKFADASETLLYFQGEDSEIESLISNAARFQT